MAANGCGYEEVRNSAFSLLEVLYAVIILAGIFVVFYAIVSQSVGASKFVRDSALISNLGESLLDLSTSKYARMDFEDLPFGKQDITNDVKALLPYATQLKKLSVFSELSLESDRLLRLNFLITWVCHGREYKSVWLRFTEYHQSFLRKPNEE